MNVPRSRDFYLYYVRKKYLVIVKKHHIKRMPADKELIIKTPNGEKARDMMYKMKKQLEESSGHTKKIRTSVRCVIRNKYHTKNGKKRMSEAKKGKKNPNYGGLSEEHKKKLSISKRKSGKYKGMNNPFYGKTHTPEVKAKLSKLRAERNKRIFTGKRNIVNKENQRKMIDKDAPLPEGYQYGTVYSQYKEYFIPDEELLGN